MIAGAGPAGLATAIHARLAGLSCIVLERHQALVDKACGEGLMPPGVRALRAMGVELAAENYGPFAGIRYLDGSTVAEGRFASGPGWAVRRTVLESALLARARALGAEVAFSAGVLDFRDEGRSVRIASHVGPLRASWLVGADGLHSSIRRTLGLARPAKGARRFGVRRHYRVPRWSDFVEIYWCDEGEAYVSPVSEREVGIAILHGLEKESFGTLLMRFGPLYERLGAAPVTSRDRGAGPLRQDVARRYRGRVALVGDAAGYLDALTGEGITLAFRSAAALVETLRRERPLEEYEQAYREITRAYYRMTGLMLEVAARPALRRRVIRMLAKNPGLFGRVLSINLGEAPLASLGFSGLWRLLVGLL